MMPDVTLLASHAVRVTVLLSVVLLTMRWLRPSSAALRHSVLTTGVVLALALPLATNFLPGWRLLTSPAAPADQPVAAVGIPAADMAPDSAATGAGTSTRPAPPTSWSWPLVLPALWLTGVAIGFVSLAAGFVQLARLKARAVRVSAGPWLDMARTILGDAGTRRQVRILESSEPGVLITWGTRRPTILIPAGADRWPAERIRVVLVHELAHATRGDWAMQLSAEVLRALHWFNPLVWLVCRRLRDESERASDDAVLQAGVRPSVYARHLVDLARHLGGRQPALSAPAMAQSSRLEGRVQAMLNDTLDHGVSSRRARTTAAAALVVLAIAVASGHVSQARVAGLVSDDTGRPTPGVTVVVTHEDSQTTQRAVTDREGRYEITDVPAGVVTIAASLPGFLTEKTVATTSEGSTLSHDVRMRVGSIRETVHVAQSGSPPSKLAGGIHQKPAEPCVDEQVGGQMKAPWKITHVAPGYPAELAGVVGTVEVEGTVSAEGVITAITVTSDPHPGLTRSAIDAFRQWRYTPTLLNCEAVPVRINARITFGS